MRRGALRFPNEEEVLFLPNTAFEITTTLFGATDIGQFYCRVDNIAMEERGHPLPPPFPATRFLCSVARLRVLLAQPGAVRGFASHFFASRF